VLPVSRQVAAAGHANERPRGRLLGPGRQRGGSDKKKDKDFVTGRRAADPPAGRLCPWARASGRGRQGGAPADGGRSVSRRVRTWAGAAESKDSAAGWRCWGKEETNNVPKRLRQGTRKVSGPVLCQPAGCGAAARSRR